MYTYTYDTDTYICIYMYIYMNIYIIMYIYIHVFFFFFFFPEVYPGPIYRFCIKNRSSGQPSITFVSSFIITYIMMGNVMR